jgi:signal transduction histidine kinase
VTELASLGPAGLLHLVPPVATVVLSAGMLYWLATAHRDTRGVRTFSALLVVGGVGWQLLTILHVVTTWTAFHEFVVVWEKWAGLVATILWAVFAFEYTDRPYHRRPGVQAVMGFVVVGYFLLAVTNDFHTLLFTDIVAVAEPFAFSSATRAPLYFVFLALAWGLTTFSFLLLVQHLLTTRKGAGTRVLLLGIGALSVTALNSLSVMGLGPISQFQYGSYGAFPFIVFTTLAVFRLGLFDIAPIARNTLVESLSDPVVVVDDGNALADYNREATVLWPDVPAHVGDPLATACPELAAHLGDEFPETVPETADRLTLPSDEGFRHYSVQISPVGDRDGGDHIGYAVLLREITELEESRQHLERQNERLDRVASTISHDLRNPLSVAQGYLELLESELDDEQLLEYVAKVDSSTARMGEIIDDILTLTQESQQVQETAELDLSAVAREAWANVDTGESELVVERDGRLWANRSRLLTVFENLFRNAVEHGSTGNRTGSGDAVEHGSTDNRTADEPEQSTDGVTVTVSTYGPAQTREIASAGSGQFGFVVEDDGSGIPPADSDQLFEYGFSTDDGGTGLGLSIVETMAESHGWTVELDEEYRDGARFVFSDVFIEPAAPAETGS